MHGGCRFRLRHALRFEVRLYRSDTTSAYAFAILYGAYAPSATDGTLGGFLAWLPSHWFGALAGVAIIWFRTHAGYNRAVNPTATTIPNPAAK